MSEKPVSEPSVTPFAVIKIILVMIVGLIAIMAIFTVFGLLSTALLWQITTKLGLMTAIIVLAVLLITWIIKPKK